MQQRKEKENGVTHAVESARARLGALRLGGAQPEALRLAELDYTRALERFYKAHKEQVKP
ncbi:hypothetical protein LZC95_08405 [Pendulispora brunnea]|uniref:Uncharacterized protein n=1 Tax=Pendulispora brunnea TaxID=2905690 RepID=A0ABZ2KDS6_9BACT